MIWTHPLAPSATAIVGASRGIGAALAARFVDAGVPVLAASRTEGAPCTGATAAKVDVRHREDLRPLPQWLERFPSPRLVVLTAGVLGPVGPHAVEQEETFLECLHVNVLGVSNVIGSLLPVLSGDDRFVVLMGGGVGGPNMESRAPAYVASKAAVATLLEALARAHYVPFPVIGLSPGRFATDFEAALRSFDSNIGIDVGPAGLTVEPETLDVSGLVGVLNTLCGPLGEALSGRVFAPARDVVDSEFLEVCGSSDFMRLRRVDGQSVVAESQW